MQRGQRQQEDRASIANLCKTSGQPRSRARVRSSADTVALSRAAGYSVIPRRQHLACVERAYRLQLIWVYADDSRGLEDPLAIAIRAGCRDAVFREGASAVRGERVAGTT